MVALGIGFLLAGFFSKAKDASGPSGPTAKKGLFFAESFDYPAGEKLQGKAGGFGFGGAWEKGGFNSAPDAPHKIDGTSLTFNGLAATGGACKVAVATTIVGLERPLADPGAFSAPGTRYVSVLLRPDGVLNAGPLNGFFGLSLRSKDSELFFGKPGNEALGKWVIEERGGAEQVASDAPVVLGQATLLVLKIEYKPGADRVTLFVNPKPGAPEPKAATIKDNAKLGSTDTLVIYSTGAFSVDEIRGGDSFQSVTPTGGEKTTTLTR